MSTSAISELRANTNSNRLFHGTRKKLRVKRKLFDAEGKISREDKDLEIQVKPGMKAGSKFKFRGVGDEIDGTKQDLHFIVEEVSISPNDMNPYANLPRNHTRYSSAMSTTSLPH